MSDPISQFVAGLDYLAAAPGRRGPLIIYRVDVLAGQHAGHTIETAVETAELANWPVAPPHWIHLPATVTFAQTNCQPSPIPGWQRHSRQIPGWGTDPNPAQAWLAHVRGVLARAR
jgi:nicotinamidase-related amidase